MLNHVKPHPVLTRPDPVFFSGVRPAVAIAYSPLGAVNVEKIITVTSGAYINKLTGVKGFQHIFAGIAADAEIDRRF
jgi:hypothetical protein